MSVARVEPTVTASELERMQLRFSRRPELGEPLCEAFEQRRRGLDAEVGLDEDLLDLLKQLLVDAPSAEGAQRTQQRALGLAQPGAQTAKETATSRLLRGSWGVWDLIFRGLGVFSLSSSEKHGDFSVR